MVSLWEKDETDLMNEWKDQNEVEGRELKEDMQWSLVDRPKNKMTLTNKLEMWEAWQDVISWQRLTIIIIILKDKFQVYMH